MRAPVAWAYAAFILVGVSAGAGGVLLPAQIDDYGVDRATIGLTFFTFALRHRRARVGAQCVPQRASRRDHAAQPATRVLRGRALLGPVLAAWMLGFLAWTSVWLVLAVASLLLAVGFLATYPAAPAPALPEPPGPPVRGGLLVTALRQPAVLLGAGLLAVYVGLEISVGNWGFSYLVTERGQPDLVAGYTVSGYWLGLTLGRFLISPIATRLGMTAAGMTFGCLAGVTAAATLVWLAPAVTVAGAGFALLGFFLGPIFPTAMAVTPRLTTARLVPTAIGVMNGVSLVGGAGFPWLAGAISQGVGLWTLLPYAALLALLQLVIWWRLVARMAVPGRDPVG